MEGTASRGARTAFVLLAGGLIASGAFASDALARTQKLSVEPRSEPQAARGGAGDETLLRADSLLGMKVRNRQGEELGSIDDLAFDKKLQEAAYAALSIGGGKLVAVPTHALKKMRSHDFLLLDISKQQLLQAPTFGSNDFPAHADIGFWQRAGVVSGPTEMETRRMEEERARRPAAPHVKQVYKLTDVRTYDTKSRDGVDLGKLHDLLIDMHEGRIAYGVVSLSKVEAMTHEMVIVPADRIEFRPDEHEAQVDASVDTLKTVAFSEHNYPTLSARYLRRISQRFETEPYWEVYGYPPPQPQPPPGHKQGEGGSQSH